MKRKGQKDRRVPLNKKAGKAYNRLERIFLTSIKSKSLRRKKALDIDNGFSVFSRRGGPVWMCSCCMHVNLDNKRMPCVCPVCGGSRRFFARFGREGSTAG